MSVSTLTRPHTPAGTPEQPPRRPRPTSPLLSRAVVNTVLVLATVWTVLPLTWLAISATKDFAGLFGSGGFAFDGFHLFDNIVNVLREEDGIYLEWMLNSVLYAGAGALVGSFISLCAGYAFDKYTFPGKEKLFGFVLVGVLVPAAATAMPLYLMASQLGLANSFWSVFLPGLVNPFGVYLARVFSSSFVPNELLEASRVDGAGELFGFFRISLPLLRPAFATLFLFSFTAGWNSFYLPLLMLSDHHLYPVSLGLYQWKTTLAADPDRYPLVIVGSLLAVLPVVLAFFGLQRHWKAGLTSGAVK